MLISNNESKRARQGHYRQKGAKKVEEVERKQGWYSPKPQNESKKFQQASPWKNNLLIRWVYQ